jgi:hypothetical protein
MTIDLEQLEKAIGIVFKHLAEQGVSTVEIDEDFYWNVPTDEVYVPTNSPANLDVGQLSFNWSDLQSIANGKSPAIGYGLVWAAPLLRRIGELHIS